VPFIQREMKFEIQTKNRIFRNDGRTAKLLPRKFGPKDFLVRGNTGVRLESETDGVIEFETTWDKKWPVLRDQIREAFKMTKDINTAKNVPGGRKEFPFDVPNLRTGTRREQRKGFWRRRKGMEGKDKDERILGKGERLEVLVSDDTWNSGIQSSESFLLTQYESYLREHEWPAYREPLIADAQDILDRANTEHIPAKDLVRLRSLLQIIVNYIMRGKGGESSKKAGVPYAYVKGKPAKQAFTLMSRTDFSSMYRSLLSEPEQDLFKTIVRRRIILTEMGLTRRTPFFPKGYGAGHRGPTVHQWLTGIYQGKDLLSSNTGRGLSAAMGKFSVQTEKGKKDTGLVKFETRNRLGGAWRTANKWEKYALDRFKSALKKRSRPTGKGETGLELKKRK
jgi:hypothetical protein